MNIIRRLLGKSKKPTKTQSNVYVVIEQQDHGRSYLEFKVGFYGTMDEAVAVCDALNRTSDMDRSYRIEEWIYEDT